MAPDGVFRVASAIHVGPILAIAFGATREHVYSASLDGDVVLRDAADGAVVARWGCHAGPVTDLCFDGAGQRLVTSGHDGRVRLWHPVSGTLLRELTGHRAGVFAVAIRGDTLASASFDQTVRIWDAVSGGCIATLAGHTNAVTDVEFIADDVVASASRDRTIRLWRLQSASCLRVLVGHEAWVTRVAALRDGVELLSTSEDGSLRRWNCATGDLLDVRYVPHRSPIWGIAVDPGSHHAIAGAAGSTTLWQLKPKVAATPAVISDATSRAIAFDTSGAGAALGNDASDVVVYDVATGDAQTLRGDARRILALAVDPLRTTGAVGTATGVMVQDRGDWRRCEDHSSFTYALATLDRGRFAAGAFDGRVVVRDFDDGAPIRIMDHRGLVFSLAYAPMARRLVSAGADCLRLWDLDAGASCWQHEGIGSGAHTMADITADAAHIVSVGEDATLRIFDVADEARSVRLIALETDLCCAIRLLPSGVTAIIGTAYGELFRVELSSGRARRLHAQHEDWIRSLRVTPDGRYVISASQQGICRAYDLAAECLVHTKQLARHAVAAVDVQGTHTAVLALCDGQLLRVDLSASSD